MKMKVICINKLKKKYGATNIKIADGNSSMICPIEDYEFVDNDETTKLCKCSSDFGKIIPFINGCPATQDATETTPIRIKCPTPPPCPSVTTPTTPISSPCPVCPMITSPKPIPPPICHCNCTYIPEITPTSRPILTTSTQKMTSNFERMPTAPPMIWPTCFNVCKSEKIKEKKPLNISSPNLNPNSTNYLHSPTNVDSESKSIFWMLVILMVQLMLVIILQINLTCLIGKPQETKPKPKPNHDVIRMDLYGSSSTTPLGAGNDESDKYE
jgi:hypothetical protein